MTENETAYKAVPVLSPTASFVGRGVFSPLLAVEVAREVDASSTLKYAVNHLTSKRGKYIHYFVDLK